MKRTLLCLAMIATSLAVSPAVSAKAAPAPQLVDSFDKARDTDPTYGLNDSLGARQSGTARGVTYTRVAGTWESTNPPPPYYSQVNHPNTPGKLLFALTRSAVRLDAPVAADLNDSYTVTATVDPDPKSLGTPGDWSSIMLSRTSGSVGYVTNGDIQLGLTVARNGDVQLFRSGTALFNPPLTATRAADGFHVSVAVANASQANPSVTVTVNGAARTIGLGTALPNPYLYLGAYVSNDKQISTVDDLTVSRVSRFADNFDGANDVDPGYGLNDGLGGRQSPLATQTYTRVSGNWWSYDPPPTWYSQVNHPNTPGKLLFAISRSAVRLDAPVAPDTDGSYTVSATVDPDPKLLGAPADWNSIMLSQSKDSSGYVTNGDVQLGLTVARNGNVQLFRSGVALFNPVLTATRAADGFHVTIAVANASKADPSVTVTVNGASRTVGLGASIPKPYLYLGAYVSNDKQISTVDDLAISRIDPYPNLKYYGYFAERILKRWGNHIPEVTGFANLHWISVSPDYDNPSTGYALSDLDSCPAHSCALYVGDEFFPHETCQNGTCPIDPGLVRWKAFLEKVKPYQDKIGAIYLKDEPHDYGVTNADLQTMASAVKSSYFGSLPILLTLSGGKVNPNTYVPAEVDWLGADDYGADAARLDYLIDTMERMTGGTKKIYLFPPTVVGPYTGQYDTPEKIQAVQQVYFDAAKRHPSVIAIMNFGPWVEAWPGQPITYPYQIPDIWATQERLGNAVTVKE
ncbi:hypothetical protein [Nonomuraea sediminis]|uniref:hypothetical protein n=1 Tax=Nonomuraea sediminis TaxID=2835864 RepID=UPI001BDDC373|nr:hypothetical protein [Nonomuraea sediminis]